MKNFNLYFLKNNKKFLQIIKYNPINKKNPEPKLGIACFSEFYRLSFLYSLIKVLSSRLEVTSITLSDKK